MKKKRVVFSTSELEKILTPLDVNPASTSPKGTIFVDSKAIKEFLAKKKDLEQNHFPKVKMIFGWGLGYGK